MKGNEIKKIAVVVAMTLGVVGCAADSKTISMTSELTVKAVEPTDMEDALIKTGALDKVFSGPNGLIGVVVKGKDGAKGSIAWLTPDKKNAMVGSLVTMTGENLTVKAYNEYIGDGPVAKEDVKKPDEKADAKIYIADESEYKNAAGIDLFSGDKVVYVVADPNCSYCNKFYHLMMDNESMIRKNGVNIKWLPVGALSNDSVLKAAAILKKGKAGLAENEGKGSIQGIDDKDMVAAVENTLYLVTQSIPKLVTPSLIWFKDGKMMVKRGAPGKVEFEKIIKFAGK